MNNRLTSSPDTLSGRLPLSAQHGKSTPLVDDSFWEEFAFFDGFEQAVEQAVPFVPLTPFSPVSASDNAEPSPAATPVQWSSLQTELLEALDNISYPPFSFSLQLPQLGDIDARLATLAPRGWDIALRFSRESYQNLKDRRESCRRALSDALDCPVNLRFDVRESYR
ncbi:type III secretion system HrpP C-terminal domain-containing protein [Brenneria izbisi]|uniref:Type III secretion system HrpP C-terminal domain-containing protein n=1 Tax=Brenneria izbisi TaxID=2939450 RepID=A0AA42C1K1_9GAMM|nr:type III secretion system HrpP C-terminal domain-containing protein [Brenneria izbisi]MCV9877538.1 type III secretion system HrpP C-terminal domain-containing protein [Brenneria izbisi]MCV9880897.1 type III secretion system HrpP C-terminal domain-containing protein [Brenneria izbisi]